MYFVLQNVDYDDPQVRDRHPITVATLAPPPAPAVAVLTHSNVLRGCPCRRRLWRKSTP